MVVGSLRYKKVFDENIITAKIQTIVIGLF